MEPRTDLGLRDLFDTSGESGAMSTDPRSRDPDLLRRLFELLHQMQGIALACKQLKHSTDAIERSRENGSTQAYQEGGRDDVCSELHLEALRLLDLQRAISNELKLHRGAEGYASTNTLQ